MTRIARAWGQLEPERRLAAVAALALLATMFLPWYELQSLNRKTGAIDSRTISAFGDVSFVEAAVFLVAAGVLALLFARAERHDFHMPGSDGAVVMVAGGWATLLIFYRVFSRPDGHGYPVGIQWGFFLAFVAAGLLTYAGWRMRATAEPEPPLLRTRSRARTPAAAAATARAATPAAGSAGGGASPSEELTVVAPAPERPVRATQVPASARGEGQPPPARGEGAAAPARGDGSSAPARSAAPGTPATAAGRKRPRYPPAPSQQLSFEDQPAEPDRR
jgi:hypothetical protein